MSLPSRALAGLLIVALAAPGMAQSPTPPVPQAANDTAEEMQPKFIWGILIKFAVNYAISAFGNYLLGKLTEQITPIYGQQGQGLRSGLPPSAAISADYCH